MPAALGALTDLAILCARPLARREGPARPAPPIGALMRACGAAQRPELEPLDRHDRQLDQLAGEAHVAVRRPRAQCAYAGAAH